ncbi:MAG: carbamoyl-phosphate synthase (glutamine-hydrolyzing) large subunit [Planctomycetes bacterium]|nr:carbamoyl-phosphate synthase (glutamine-hydrolyzing) large subunit [Planctomycetota bacterium]
MIKTKDNNLEEKKVEKVIILGSGGLQIGQAGEFDYSGSQAIKALKEEGVSTVLVNPNIATIQTSEGLADKIYFLPVNPEFVERVIEKEMPDGILPGFGGQTALNCGVELYEKGIPEKYNVQVLGTSIETIQNTEDRDLFIKKLNEINVKSPKSVATTTIEQAIDAAEEIGYPVMIRVAYALGGRGSGICRSRDELIGKCREAFSSANQVLVEEWLGGWKEIEYEVVRDKFDNCITVCNMENFDPLGIHTGESIVVAPSQTLSNTEYHKLRNIALRVIRHLGIIGECNIQYALDPKSEDYRIIEVNARLSRSSALASKATGYPLAFIAAKLALGHSLIDIENKITKKTKACFEPALDYVVIKIPRWDLKKFKEVDEHIGSEMKSVGEVMSIGRKFEEALQKSLRMIATGMHGLTLNRIRLGELEEELKHPTDKRIFAIGEAMKQGWSVEKIHELTKIDKWFLYKLKNIIDCEIELNKRELDRDLLFEAKQLGFSDFQLSKIKKISLMDIRKLRKKLGVLPCVKQIDTLAAEFPAQTNYLYFTYNGIFNDVEPSSNSVIVLGSGAYRIGSSVEFDWCCVNSVMTTKKLGFNTIMINYNPETVSTDYDVCDKLYFDEMSFERVLDIYEFENPEGIIVSMGGQIPNNLAVRLHQVGVRILGTTPESIDNAEDRNKFSKLLDELKIDQPDWKELTSIKKAIIFANDVGYPVLIRPSYVLSGAAMNVVWDDESHEKYLNEASEVNPQYPVVITKFIEDSKEVEIDAAAKDGEILIYAISEHIENAGVHSGDATIVLPAQHLYIETIRRVKKISRQIAKSLRITGPFNIQFLAYKNNIKVIECNLRASRSFPFCSKVFKQNMIDYATRAILGDDVKPVEKSSLDLDYVGVKAAQFSFSRLKGADPTLGVEMASTGEVGCIGHELNEAFLKAFLSVGFKIPKKNILLSTGPLEKKARFLESAIKLKEMGYYLYASPGTGKFLEDYGIDAEILNWPLSEKKPNIKDFIMKKKIDLVLNIPKNNQKEELENDYLIRRLAVDFEIPLITNLKVAIQMIDALESLRDNKLDILSWDEY